MSSRTVGWMLLSGSVVVNALLGLSYAREVSAIDRCLEAGGSFDYGRAVCDFSHSHAAVAFRIRHPQAFAVGIAGGAAALLGGALIGRKIKHAERSS